VVTNNGTIDELRTKVGDLWQGALSRNAA